VRGTFPIARVFGIPILVNASWFISLALVVSVLALQVFPDFFPGRESALYWSLGLTGGLVFFASIVLHELGHSVVARRYGIPVKSITLFIFGGVAQITREAPRPLAELLMAFAGPFVSLLLGAIFLGVKVLLLPTDTPGSGRSARRPGAAATSSDSSSGVLRGTPTSPGLVTGTARVITRLHDLGRLEQGDILVTNSTDPGWTPAVLLIKGLVLETGGMLAQRIDAIRVIALAQNAGRDFAAAESGNAGQLLIFFQDGLALLRHDFSRHLDRDFALALALG